MVSDPGVVCNFSLGIWSAVHISRGYRLFQRIEEEVVFFCIGGIHEQSSCSCVQEYSGLDGLFSRVVLHIMGVINVIHCFPILATNTVKIVSNSDVGTDRLPKNPLPLSLLGLSCFFLQCSCPL